MSKITSIGKRRGDTYDCVPEHLVIIGLDTTDGIEHALYDERAFKPLDEGTVNNIMKIGVQEPVIVMVLDVADVNLTEEATARMSGEVEGIGKHTAPVVGVVIDGRRRVLHARRANAIFRENDAPQMVIPGDEKKVLEGTDQLFMSMTLNSHREADDPVTLARKGKALYDRTKDWKQVCDAMKMSKPPATRYFRLLSHGSDAVKAAVRAQEIPTTAAILFAERLKKADQDEILDKAKKTLERRKKAYIQKEEEAGKKDPDASGIRLTLEEYRQMILDHEDAAKAGETTTGTGGKDTPRKPPQRVKTPKKRTLRAVMTAFEQVPGGAKVTDRARREAEFVVSILAWALDGSEPPESVQKILKQMEADAEAEAAQAALSKEEKKAARAAEKAKAKDEKKAKALAARAAGNGSGADVIAEAGEIPEDEEAADDASADHPADDTESDTDEEPEAAEAELDEEPVEA